LQKPELPGRIVVRGLATQPSHLVGAQQLSFNLTACIGVSKLMVAGWETVLATQIPNGGLAPATAANGRLHPQQPTKLRGLVAPGRSIGRPLLLLLFSLLLAGDSQQFLALTPATSDRAATPLGPEHVALVINAQDPLSEAIGQVYAQVRAIPSANVIRVRFPVPSTSLDPTLFSQIRSDILRRTPNNVQIYALAWAAPWQVGCQSITGALSFGVRQLPCPPSCNTTRLNPYFARGEIRRPWQQLGLRLSMLLAARDLSQATALIQRGKAADGSAPPGTVYLMSTSDRKRNIRSLRYGEMRATLGGSLRVKSLQGDRLSGANDVIAYFTGLPRVEAIASNRYRPGAVADHLTSFAGLLTPTDAPGAQMSALRWLEAGATGSYGTVVEPCAIAEKFPDPVLLLTYYRGGDTLVESYWRSVAMPEQGVFIGEPLARPWP
jgi:uncharacterized protein (TIGR03790 family)